MVFAFRETKVRINPAKKISPTFNPDYKRKENIMKKLNGLLLISLALFSASCSSTYQAGTPVPDDIYYSSSDPAPAAPARATYPATPPAPAQDYTQEGNNYNQNADQQNYTEQQNTSSDYYQDGQGNTYITNNYYNDDYYDYSYSSRLRRFYGPVYGYGYYDPFYTNSYFYDYYPSSWGVSIYSTYNWWAPSYYYSSPFCYGGIGISIGYSPIFSPWYSPWYHDWYYPGSYYHGYYRPYSAYNHGYFHGYNQGYNHGYYDGYYGQGYTPYYYNSFDATSTYYGPRGGSSSNSPRSSGRQSSLSPMSLGEKYQIARQEGRISNISSEGLRGNDSRNQDAGGSLQERKQQVNPGPDRNSPARSGESKESIDRNPRQTPVNSGEMRDNSNQGRGNGSITRPSQGEVRPSNNAEGASPVRQNPAVRDNRDQAPSGGNNNQDIRNNSPVDKKVNGEQRPANPVRREGNSDMRPGAPSNMNGNGVERNNNQPSRNTVPQRSPSQESRPGMRPEQKNITQPESNPRQRDTEIKNNNTPRRQSSGSEIRMEEKERSGSRELNRSREHQYANPSQEKNPSRSVSPRQESRTPILQPRNEPRQYKQENSGGSQQRNINPSTPSRQENNRGGNPRR